MPKKGPENRKSSAEKTRRPENPTIVVIDETRKRIEATKLKETFGLSKAGQNILESYGTIDKILQSEGILSQVAIILGRKPHESGTASVAENAKTRKALSKILGSADIIIADEPELEITYPSDNFNSALAFFLLFAQEKPDFVKSYVSDPYFNQRLASEICAKMKWDIKELTKPKPETDTKPAPRKHPDTTPKTTEQLVADLEKTEVFKGDVISLITCDEIIAKADFPVDWDDEISKMPEYTVENIMAFLAQNGKRVQIPTISIEDILSNPVYLEKVMNRLEWDHDNVNARHFGAFVLMAAKRNPKLVFDYFSGHTYAEVRDAESKKAIVELLIQSGFPQASASMFELPPEQNN